MSEQDGIQHSTKRRKSRNIYTTTEQNGLQPSAPQRPALDDKDGWKAYWEAQGQSWRTEPEIDKERQNYLDERRQIKPDIGQNKYSFQGIKLSRADIEWLLATHENGRGPVVWNDENQRKREGLDLRGADLRGIDLRRLPLAKMIGGPKWKFGEEYPVKSYTVAAIHMEGAKLSYAHLEKAVLVSAHLESVQLDYAHLEYATLDNAYLEHAYLYGANLEHAHLYGANLRDAILDEAHLEEASLFNTHFERAEIINAHFEGATLFETHLEGSDISGAFFNGSTDLFHIILNNEQYGSVSLCDIHWKDVNIAVVDWSTLTILGDELSAIPRHYDNGEPKNLEVYTDGYQTAVRAYRQLAVVLRNQGFNEDAAPFAYRAQLMQRTVFKLQKKFKQYLFSLLLDLLAGYGYKPWRSFVAYLIVILTFAIAYFIIGRTTGPSLSPLGSVVFSMTSFHGRGFFPGGIGLDDPLTVLAAIEAFVGLLIEVTFIATLTQRLFGK